MLKRREQSIQILKLSHPSFFKRKVFTRGKMLLDSIPEQDWKMSTYNKEVKIDYKLYVLYTYQKSQQIHLNHLLLYRLNLRLPYESDEVPDKIGL